MKNHYRQHSLKRLLKGLFLSFFFLLISNSLWGQTYNLKFEKVSNNGTTLVVKVQMSLSSAENLGSSNLVFTYDGAEMSNPVLGTVHNFGTGNYQAMTLTSPATNTVSLNIELNTDDAGTALATGSGFTDVAEISFTLPDETGTADFQWQVATTTKTVVYQDDNSTQLSAGTLTNNDLSLDATAPSAPASLDLSTSSDTGNEEATAGATSDNRTNDNTPNIAGTSEANATINVTSNVDGLVGTTAADGSGNWNVDLSTLSAGAHTLTATATDAANNVSGSSSGLAIIIDTTQPTVAITSTSTSPTNDNPIPITITFSEEADGFKETDITVTNGTTGDFASADSTTFTFNLTPGNASGNSEALTVDVGVGSATDLAGNFNTSAPQFAITYDGAVPTISTVSLDGSNGFIDVTFSDGVYNTSGGSGALENADFSLSITGGTATSPTVTSVTQTGGGGLAGGETTIRVNFSISGTANGAETLEVDITDGSSIFDAAGNAAAANQTSNNTATLNDKAVPSISSVSLDGSNGFIDVTFSEGVFNTNGGSGALQTSDFSLSLTGGTATSPTVTSVTQTGGGGLAGGETTIRVNFSVTGTPDGSETLEVDITDGSSIFDAAGNAAVANQTSNNTATLNDATVPTISSVSLAANNTFIDVTFSEGAFNTNGGSGALQTSDFSLSITGGTATSPTATSVTQTGGGGLAGGETTIRVNFSVTGSVSGAETLEVDLGSNAVFDAAGNAAAANQTSNNTASMADVSGPTISSVSLDGSNGFIDVTFDEGAFNTNGGSGALETTDFSLSITGGTATSPTVTSVTTTGGAGLSGGETTIRVNFTTTGTPAGAETLEVDLGSNAVFDAAGNASVANQTSNNTATLNDETAPTVTSVSSSTANGSYKVGDAVVVTVTFSEAVTVTGTPQLTLETGTTDRTIDYNGTGSGTATLQFGYTVQAGDVSADLNYVATTSLSAGTSIQDAASNNATLTLPAPAGAGSLATNKAIVIDGVVPTLSSVTIASSQTAAENFAEASHATTGNLITLSFTASEALNGNPTVGMSVGGTGVTPTVNTGSAPNYTATYTILGTENNGAVTFTIDFTDAAGNAGTQVTATTNASSIEADFIAPTLSSVTIVTDNGTDNQHGTTGDEITLAFTADDDLSANPTVSMSVGGTNVTPTVNTGSAPNYTATYTLLGSENEGAVTFTIDFVDDAGISGTQVTATTDASSVEADFNAPTLTTVTLLSNNGTNDQQATDGNTILLDIVSSDVLSALPTVGIKSGGVNVQGPVTVAHDNPGAPDFQNFNVTYTVDGTGTTVGTDKDGEGALTFTIDFTDDVGIAGTQVTATTNSSSMNIDYTAPSGYTITIDQSPINAANVGSGSFTFAGAEIGASYQYVATTSGGAATVTTGGTIVTGTDQVTILALSGFQDGTITVSVTLTDISGNTGIAATDTETKDTVAPVISEVTAVTTPGNDNTPNYTFTTNETGTFAVGGSAGTSTSTTISSTGNQTITFTQTDNSSALADGDYTDVTIIVTDAAGNSSTALAVTNFTVDASLPVNPIVTTPAAATNVNAATQTISGTHTEDGVVVHAYADADNNGTADNATSLGNGTVSGGNWSLSVNLTADAANNFVVQAADGAGNVSGDVDVPTITEDSQNPIVNSISPSDDATDVSIADDITITFNEDIQFGTGGIQIIDLTDGSNSFIIDAAAPGSEASISGSVLTLSPSGNLDLNSDYAIAIGATAIDDLAGNDFAGILNTTVFNFTTVATTVAFSSTSSSGAESTASADLEVTLNAISGVNVTVDYAVTGTAGGSGTDYTLADGTLTINSGSLTNNISISSIVADLLDENNETVIVTLSNPTNAGLGTNTMHTYTINDDDPTPTVQLSQSNATFAENGGTNTITATSSAASGKGDITVTIAVKAGATTATVTDDYTLSSTTITITEGTTTGTAVLTAVQDLLDEPDETITVEITGVTNADEDGTQEVASSITDDDATPTIGFNTTTSSGAESTASANLQVDLSAVSGQNVSVDYTVTGTATGSGTDYTLADGTLNLNAGASLDNITIASIVSNALDEDDETVIVTLSNPVNATLGTNTVHTYTILDDDATPTISFTTASSNGAESASSKDLQVDLSSVSGRTVTADYAVTGTATAGTDFTLADGTLTFTAGDGSETITIASIVDDAILESNETVIVTLSNLVNATAGTNQVSTYTIFDNDAAAVTIADISGAENGGDITVTATLDNAVQGGFTVDVNTADGTAETTDSDYTGLTSETLTFAGTAGEMQTFIITPGADTKFENDETLTVSMDNLAATSLSVDISDGATVTINNDDTEPTVTLSVDNNSIAENGGVATLTATLSNLSVNNVTVNLALSGTATIASDFVSSGASITVNAGQSTGTDMITAQDDSDGEGPETIIVDMDIVTNGTEDGTQQQTITIIDDDAAVITSVTSSTANGSYKAGDLIEVQMTFSQAVSVTGSPQLTLETGTTDQTADYTSGDGTTTLTFNYTVQAGDGNNDLDYTSTTALVLNGGTIIGNSLNAILDLPAPGATNSLGDNAAIIIDTTSPVDPVVTTPATSILVNAANQTVSGTHSEDGVTIHAYADSNNDGAADNTTSLGSATVSSNAWSFSVNLTGDAANNFVVQAMDAAGNTSAQVDVPTITEDSTSPVITSDGGAATASVNVNENSTAVTTVTSTDANAVTYTISGGADQALFSMTSGVLTFTTAPDFENPGDANTDNAYVVEVTASDGVNAGDTQTITVTVADLDDNSPVMTSDGGMATAALTVNENATAVTTVTATDADGVSTVAYSISGGADQALFSMASGVLTFTAAPDFENPADANTDNAYEVEVSASDGSTTADTQTITVTVADLNDNNPVITASQALSVDETASNTTSVGTVVATDADAGTTFSSWAITAGNGAGIFAINAATGEITIADNTNLALKDVTASYTLTLTVSDGTNTSAAETITVNILDTTPPAAPVVVSISDDNGSSTSDGITNDNTLNFTGTAVANNTVEVFVDGTSIGTTTSDGSGDYTFDYTGTALSDGVKTITAKTSDASGNQSVASAALSITVDTAPPAKPVLTSISDDTGISSSDAITSDDLLIFSGTAEPFSVVSLEAQGFVFITAVADANGDWVADFTNRSLALGVTVTSTAVDVAGNVSAVSDPLVIVIDKVAPEVTAITRDDPSPTAASSVDYTVTFDEEVHGLSASNFGLVFTGTQNASIASVSATSGTSVTVTVNNITGEGTFGLNLTSVTGITDVAGNTLSGTFTGELYTTNSTPTDIGLSSTSILENNSVGDAVGTLSSTDVDTGDTHTYTLVAGTGDTDNASFSINGTQLEAAAVFDLETKGSYSIRVQTDDGSGGTFQKAFTITIDNVNDNNPVITAGQTLSVDETASNSTSVGTVVATDQDAGTAFSSWAITAGNGAGIFAINAATGEVTIANNTNLSPRDMTASYTLTLTVSDGMNTSATETVTINILDTTAPAAPVVVSISDDNGSNTSDGITNDNTLNFIGTAEANSTVEVFIDGSSIGTTTADGSGDWTYDHTASSLSDASYSITANTSDASGNTSALSAAFSLTIDTALPQKVGIGSISDDTGISNSDAITNDDLLIFYGTAEPFSVVSLEAQNFVFITAVADANGDWVADFTNRSLALGVTVTSTSVDIAGNVSPVSDPFVIVIDKIAPQVTAISRDDASPTMATSVDYTVTFDEEVHGLSASNFGLVFTGTQNASIASVSATSGASVTVTVNNVTGEGTFGLNLTSVTGITDVAGNALAGTFTGELYTTNSTPTDIGLSSTSILENNTIGDAVGTLSSTDVDAGDTHTYTLVAGTGDTDNASFSINGTQLEAAAVFDLETKASYSIRVQTDDGSGGTFQKAFTITIDNVPEADLRITGNNDIPATPLGITTNFDITVHNDGDAAMTISSILYPTAFGGPVAGINIPAASSQVITMTFTPTVAQLYTGDITIVTNGGTGILTVSADGAIITGTDDGILTADAINIYPNPASDVVTVDLSEFNGRPLDIQLFDISGNKAFSVEEFREATLKLDIRTYQQGIYLMYFTDGKSTVQKKFMIRK